MTKWHPGNPPQAASEWLEAVEEHKRRRGLVIVKYQLGPQFEAEPGVFERFTCLTCQHEAYCDSAWDLYNTGGDCLEMK